MKDILQQLDDRRPDVRRLWLPEVRHWPHRHHGLARRFWHDQPRRPAGHLVDRRRQRHRPARRRRWSGSNRDPAGLPAVQPNEHHRPGPDHDERLGHRPADDPDSATARSGWPARRDANGAQPTAVAEQRPVDGHLPVADEASPGPPPTCYPPASGQVWSPSASLWASLSAGRPSRAGNAPS